MKKNALIALVLALVFIFVGTACASNGGTASSGSTASGSAAAGAETASIRLATGGTQGTYYSFGTAVAQILADKTGNQITVESTGASKANIQLVAGGDADMAIVQNDVMDYAYNGTDLFEGEKLDNFASMAACYAEVCQVVATKDSGITSIADLKGKRVSVGDAGSGVEFNAKQILSAYGVTFDDIQKQNLSFGDSSDALKDGKIDAFFCTAGAPTTAIVDLSTTKDIQILEIDEEHANKLIADYPFYTRFAVPGGSYNGIADDVMTVAVKATFIVSKDLSETVVYNLTKALFENKDSIAAAHTKGSELDTTYAVEGVSVPFHPGAEKYFKEIGVIK